MKYIKLWPLDDSAMTKPQRMGASFWMQRHPGQGSCKEKSPLAFN
jgi:hypothetical protein